MSANDNMQKYIPLTYNLRLRKGKWLNNHVWQIGLPNHASTLIFLLQVYESIMKLKL
jgi:hypothetical protein